jgi:hypothetical protein
MFEIQSDQTKSLQQATKQRFHEQLKQFLREEIPEETSAMSDQALLDRIADSEKRAAKYGIVSQSGVAQFACLTFIAGPDFDEIPEVKEFLTDSTSDLDPEERLEILVEELADDAE